MSSALGRTYGDSVWFTEMDPVGRWCQSGCQAAQHPAEARVSAVTTIDNGGGLDYIDWFACWPSGVVQALEDMVTLADLVCVVVARMAVEQPDAIPVPRAPESAEAGCPSTAKA